MAATTFLGLGASLTSKYYTRNFYASNRDAGTSSKRKEFTANELSQADAIALKRAVKSLRSFDYDSTNLTNIQSSVGAYIDTYNNLIDSTGASTDSKITRNVKQLKSLTDSYKDELDKAGITVNSDGTLTARDAMKTSGTIKRLASLFSEDSEYMQHSSAYAKRIDKRSEALVNEERQKKAVSADNSNNRTFGTSADTASTLAALTSGVLNSDTPLSPGVGVNINISL